MEIEKIYDLENNLLAWIALGNTKIKGKEFLSQKEEFLQVGYMALEEGEKIMPHLHKIRNRNISRTQEVIYVLKGKMKVNFYKNKKKICERVLNVGDLISLITGEHGFECLEKTEIFEVKQGPYLNVEEDKEKFVPLGENE